jgi:NADH-quinone oxidoreductase subunit M
MNNLPILSLIVLLPLMSAMFIMLCVKRSYDPEQALYAKYVGLLSSVLTLISSVYLVGAFDLTTSDVMQFVEKYQLIGSMGLEIHFGVDGVSVLFIALTNLLSLICIAISVDSIKKRIKEFLVCFLVLQSLTVGAFCSLNLLLFYCFFEAMLIPLCIIIGIWGGENRMYASIKFFLYTLFGSVIFLLAIIYLFMEFGTLDMISLTKLCSLLSPGAQKYIWLASFIAFAVKVPMVPVHTWLPDAHVQAPTPGSVILAGILLKVGGYGLFRVSLSMLPSASLYFSDMVMWLSVFAIVYASFVAMSQTDMKKMIAYSSVAHMGYVTGGFFSLTVEGINGGMLQMLSHGFISSGLFIVVGILYEKLHTKEISAYGGVANKMPMLAVMFMILMLGSIGLPGTSGFIAECMTILGIFSISPIHAIFAASGVVFGALYMLRLYRNVMLGEIAVGSKINDFTDIKCVEVACLLPLVLLVLYCGLFTGSVLEYFQASSNNIVNTFPVRVMQ